MDPATDQNKIYLWPKVSLLQSNHGLIKAKKEGYLLRVNLRTIKVIWVSTTLDT